MAELLSSRMTRVTCRFRFMFDGSWCPYSLCAGPEGFYGGAGKAGMVKLFRTPEEESQGEENDEEVVSEVREKGGGESEREGCLSMCVCFMRMPWFPHSSSSPSPFTIHSPPSCIL